MQSVGSSRTAIQSRTCPGSRAGVRQSSKRESIPDILEIAEMRTIVSKLQLRERTLLFLDMSTGLRRGELAGLKWKDVAFDKMLLFVERSVVDQRVGPCKTEGSKKPVPLDEYSVQDLKDWYRETPYRDPEDWIFASNSRRAGKKRGKQPLWLSSIMRYHIQPVVKELGIIKRVSWHTFRRTYTSLLTSNNENVKVVQELLRHGSVRITMDVYAQAKMQDKKECSTQGGRRISAAIGEERVGRGLTGPRSGPQRFHGFALSCLECWRPRRDSNPCYRRERAMS
jgi:integrase